MEKVCCGILLIRGKIKIKYDFFSNFKKLLFEYPIAFFVGYDYPCRLKSRFCHFPANQEPSNANRRILIG